MRKAIIRLKPKFDSDEYKRYSFWTTEILEEDDYVLVKTKYGIQLGIFERYTEGDYVPASYVITKISKRMLDYYSDSIKKSVNNTKAELLKIQLNHLVKQFGLGDVTVTVSYD